MTSAIAKPQIPKGFREDFAKFFSEPTRPALRALLKNHVGEFDDLDFKGAWPELASLAKHVLAFANSGGGAIVFGVSTSDGGAATPTGLASLVDKADVARALRRAVPSSVQWDVLDFPFPDSEYGPIAGKQFQVLFVEDTPKYLPFVAQADGAQMVQGAVYVRDGTESRPATNDQLQTLLNRRIETQHSTRHQMTLAEHLEELRFLYSQLREAHWEIADSSPSLRRAAIDRMDVDDALGLKRIKRTNPHYPEESFDSFVRKLIDDKKALIIRLNTGLRE